MARWQLHFINDVVRIKCLAGGTFYTKVDFLTNHVFKNIQGTILVIK